ncbi:MAG TPA: hypothetical protein VK923_00895 [Euzebyales bacterium]|nr:hypothetical protein [Euzebyales bacterium]
MGYRGKVAAQARARELRAQAWSLRQIADELGVAKSVPREQFGKPYRAVADPSLR